MPVLILQVITYTVYEVYNYATGNYPHYLLYPVLPLLQATIHTICYTLYYHCYRQLSTLSAIPCTTTVTGNYLLYPVLPLLQATIYTVYIYTITVRASTVNTGLPPSLSRGVVFRTLAKKTENRTASMLSKAFKRNCKPVKAYKRV